jgi:hypothetical protein
VNWRLSLVFGLGGTKVRFAMKVIAWLYLLIGLASGTKYLYAVLLGGHRDELGNAILFLLVGFGLLRYNSLARSVALLLSVVGLIGGVVGVVVCAGHLTRYWSASGGLVLEQPVLAFLLLGMALAFTAGQVWVLTRPEVAALFEKRRSEPITPDRPRD